jgi:hypothetical protein
LWGLGVSGAWKHSIQHPIRDAGYGCPGLMAALLAPLVALNRQLLRAPEGGAAAGGIKLMQQFFRRTDVSPPPHHGCHAPEWVEPRMWHMVRAPPPRSPHRFTRTLLLMR